MAVGVGRPDTNRRFALSCFLLLSFPGPGEPRRDVSLAIVRRTVAGRWRGAAGTMVLGDGPLHRAHDQTVQQRMRHAATVSPSPGTGQLVFRHREAPAPLTGECSPTRGHPVGRRRASRFLLLSASRGQRSALQASLCADEVGRIGLQASSRGVGGAIRPERPTLMTYGSPARDKRDGWEKGTTSEATHVANTLLVNPADRARGASCCYQDDSGTTPHPSLLAVILMVVRRSELSRAHAGRTPPGKFSRPPHSALLAVIRCGMRCRPALPPFSGRR